MSDVDPRTAVFARTGPLAPTPGAAPAADRERLKVLAEQFESMMVSQMLKGMQSSMFESDDDASSRMGFGPLSDALFNELSLAITRAGGLGIGKALLGPLEAQAAALAGGTPGPTGSAPVIAPPAVDGAGLAAFNPATTAAEAVAGMTGVLPTLASAKRISSAYGWRSDPVNGAGAFHKGADIPMPVGSDVRTAGAGTVVSVGTNGGYGLQVVVDHGNGVQTRYAHLSSTAVKAGDTVAKGQVIAASGNSGKSTGPHLHFEVLSGGVALDPQGVLAASLLSQNP